MSRWVSVAGRTLARASAVTGVSFVALALLAILASSESSGGVRPDDARSAEVAPPSSPDVAAAPDASEGRVPSPVSPPQGNSERKALPPLEARALVVPVLDVTRDQLRDTFHDRRGRDRVHEALDIMAPRGRAVVAVENGTVARLFQSERGGLTLYQFDPSQTYAYYYAHLDGYAEGIAEGETVHAGQILGYVGSTGNAPDHAPHLHFAIYRLGPEKRWWRGDPINPFPLLTREEPSPPNAHPPRKEKP